MDITEVRILWIIFFKKAVSIIIKYNTFILTKENDVFDFVALMRSAR